jgi:hypothetical protein
MGSGRGGRAKVAPFLLLIFNAVPAMLAVGISAFLNQAVAPRCWEQGIPIRHDNLLEPHLHVRHAVLRRAGP